MITIQGASLIATVYPIGMLIVAVNGRQLEPLPLEHGASRRLNRRNLYDSIIAACATLPLVGVVICVASVCLGSTVEGPVWEGLVYSGGLTLVPAVWWILARLITEQIRGRTPSRPD